MAPMDPDLANAIVDSAKRLGVDPVDLGTAFSYESAGTFNPNLWGGKDKNYLGIAQFGPEERAKYGVHEGMSAGDQVVAAENFLRDRGVKPGMGLPDIYSTINAGSPGRYNATDENNGGAPGTVMDKVTNQMAGHRANAQRLLGVPQVGMIDTQPAPATAAPSGPGASAPASAGDGGYAQMLTQLQKIPGLVAQKQPAYAPAPPMVDTSAARRRAIAAAQQAWSPTS